MIILKAIIKESMWISVPLEATPVYFEIIIYPFNIKNKIAGIEQCGFIYFKLRYWRQNEIIPPVFKIVGKLPFIWGRGSSSNLGVFPLITSMTLEKSVNRIFRLGFEDNDDVKFCQKQHLYKTWRPFWKIMIYSIVTPYTSSLSCV